jgi:hypothetical protein
MKKVVVIVFGFVVIEGILFAQPWIYDFGTAIKSSFTPGYSSTNFLPQPLTGDDFIRVGNSGSINLENPGIADFGSGSELRIVASNTGNRTKASIYNYDGAKLFYIRFNLLLGDFEGGNTANSGTFYFVMGNNGNSNFSGDSGYNRNYSFTILSFTFGESGSIITQYHWGLSSIETLSGNPIRQGTNYLIEIWGNNTDSNKTYYKNGTSNTLNTNYMHLWINGVKYSLNKANIAANMTINSFMFYGADSNNNVANCFVDNIVYSKALYSSPSNQASFFSNQNCSSNSIELTWTPGNGDKRIVILSTNSNIIAPEDGKDPEANSVYCSKGQQVVYNGTGNSVTVSGLSSSTTYYAKVFEVNGSGFATMYNTTGNTIQITTAEDTLPVELSNFRAELDYRNRIRILWVTQSETNLLGYYIYRNDVDDVTNAELVSPLIEATNNTSLQLYIFTDETINETGNYHYWLQCIDYNGKEKLFGPSICKYELPGTVSGAEIPLREGITSIFPNPFNPCTTISYDMDNAGLMELAIYNIKGQKVWGKILEHSGKGNYKYLWNGCDEKGKECSSGIYTVIMRCGERNYIRKMTILQ